MHSDLESIAAKIRSELSNKDAAREQALKLSREVIRYSADAIRAIHRNEADVTRDLLSQARSHLDKVSQVLSGHADIFYAGFVHNAQKEYVEACATLALIRGEPIPSVEALGVDCAAYLNGLAEAVGEMRRHMLDRLRHGETEGCEALLESMDDIYNMLISMDFPNALTGGLKRTTDMVRGVLEKTRGDLTMFLAQRDLENRLERFIQAIASSDADIAKE